jgi:hypothetical protein
MSNQENKYNSVKNYLDHHKIQKYEDVKTLLENSEHGLTIKENGKVILIIQLLINVVVLF